MHFVMNINTNNMEETVYGSLNVYEIFKWFIDYDDGTVTGAAVAGFCCVAQFPPELVFAFFLYQPHSPHSTLYVLIEFLAFCIATFLCIVLLPIGIYGALLGGVYGIIRNTILRYLYSD